jgi:hypothetical protein
MKQNIKTKLKPNVAISLSTRLLGLLGRKVKKPKIKEIKGIKKLKKLSVDTQLLISIDRTLKHSDKLAGANILIFTFLSSELIFLTIGDAFGYLKYGLTINILGYVLSISNTNFPFFSLILSAIISIPVAYLIWQFTKPNN